MPPTITEQDAANRLARLEEVSRRGRPPETTVLVEWIKAELEDIKARLEALES